LANKAEQHMIIWCELPTIPENQPVTVAADKGYDTKDFVAEARNLKVTPHVAQNHQGRRSAIDSRTTRHAGYLISQRKRKRVGRDLRRDENRRWDEEVAASRAALSRVDVHLRGGGLQPGAHPEVGKRDCWSECMRSSVSGPVNKLMSNSHCIKIRIESQPRCIVGRFS
jgi:hypothetical protein